MNKKWIYDALIVLAGVLVALLVFAAMVVEGGRNEYPYKPPACPEGRVFTETCGCVPPAIGEDC